MKSVKSVGPIMLITLICMEGVGVGFGGQTFACTTSTAIMERLIVMLIYHYDIKFQTNIRALFCKQFTGPAALLLHTMFLHCCFDIKSIAKSHNRGEPDIFSQFG